MAPTVFAAGVFAVVMKDLTGLHFSDEEKRHVIRLCKSRKYRWLKKANRNQDQTITCGHKIQHQTYLIDLTIAFP